MPGRKAKPINLHIVGGNKSRLTKAAIRARQEAEGRFNFPADRIKPPTWLPKEAQKEFKILSKMLQKAEIICNLDVIMLSIYCSCFVRYVECNRIIEADGLLILQKGVEVPHPLLRVQKMFADHAIRIASEYGFTPASRAKIAIPKKTKKEPTDFDNLFPDV